LQAAGVSASCTSRHGSMKIKWPPGTVSCRGGRGKPAAPRGETREVVSQ
jgi:hypothetical protein